MSGAGNLFVVIDNLGGKLSVSDGRKLAPVLCKKSKNHLSQEGLMFLEKGDIEYDFECKFFNPDGSQGMMCGNGGRVIARFAKDADVKLLGDNRTRFKMAGEIYSAEFRGDNIKLFMPKPNIMPRNIQLENGNVKYANTGTHHAVIKTIYYWADDFKEYDVKKNAQSIRNHLKFAPDGVNVNFYMIENGIVHMRTYEKGVEAETGACGTGAVATALVVHEDDGLNFPINIIPTSGDELIIDIIGEYPNNIENIILEGPAVYCGQEEREIKI